ncbi:glycosyltransferase family 87 protein [Tautonia marina]|uniref:glycosyltransferase family 87 protein n=1 Tax=Tautonia marina TaxID=2653855 RepID=UPI001375F5FC|nr:glycosyltransferase family 87 protein [Tautonia marina]
MLNQRFWATGPFNRLCKAVALVLLMAGAIRGVSTKPVTVDFTQYYMAGLIARHGHWDALYPIPKPGAEKHPGYSDSSIMRPRYRELLQAEGVHDYNRFVQAPPVALLLLPLGFFDYQTANDLWVFLNAICLWLVALQAARILRLLGGRSRLEGLLVVLIACSPMCQFAIRIGNISPIVGLCVGSAAMGLVTEDRLRSSLGMVVGAFAKFVTLVFVPLYVLARRWRVLITSSLLSLLLCLATLAVAGEGPFVTFAREMMPTFGRPNDGWGSITASSFLSRLYGSAPIPKQAERVVRAVELVLIILGAIGLLRSRRELPEDPVKLLAASLAMVGGFLIFSPLAWGHHLVYLVPFWGYLVWEAKQSPWSRWAIVMALSLQWATREAIERKDVFNLTEKLERNAFLGTYELWGTLFVVTFAMARLYGPSRPKYMPQAVNAAPQGRLPDGPSPRSVDAKEPGAPPMSRPQEL